MKIVHFLAPDLNFGSKASGLFFYQSSHKTQASYSQKKSLALSP